ncbi:MAG: hypothetical protein GXY48_09750 [Methanomicrobiales archaeon]|nr:hypothetical protein [Methanomicrobiales archaeon]
MNVAAASEEEAASVEEIQLVVEIVNLITDTFQKEIDKFFFLIQIQIL